MSCLFAVVYRVVDCDGVSFDCVVGFDVGESVVGGAYEFLCLGVGDAVVGFVCCSVGCLPVEDVFVRDFDVADFL